MAEEAKKPTGVKFDGNKVAYHLLPVDALDEISRVLTFGAKKYGERNWEKGIAYSRLYRALLHHILAWWSGEKVDPESGFSHLAHAACCVIFLLSFTLRESNQLDDRPNNTDLIRDVYEEEKSK